MQLYTKILIGMVLGVVLGLFLGPNSAVLPADAVALAKGAQVVVAPDSDVAAPLSSAAKHATILERDGDWLSVRWKVTTPDIVKLQAKGAELPDDLEAGDTFTGWVKDEPAKVRIYASIGQTIVDSTEWIGSLFLAMIKMVVVPLVFFSLVVGVASIGDLRRLGRLGSRTLGFFFASTIAALVIGLGLANLIQPGRLVSEADSKLLLASYADDASAKVSDAAEAPALMDQLIGIVPTNPLHALAEGEMLQVIFFAAMLGVALTFLKGDRAKPVVDVFDRLNDAMVMLVHIAMFLAPYGVAALMFKVAGTTGPSVLLALGAYTGVVLLGLALHLTLTYGLVVMFAARLNFLQFLFAMREALTVAFSTSSSSATLPVTKECVEDNINVSPAVSSFVLPLGATVNMDGTALYQGVAAVFIAQVYGLGLDLGQQLTIVVSATLASVGAAGVPGAGMVTLAMVLAAIGVPAEGLALVIGVDRLLDMFRTMTNVTGDATCTVLMARLEGEDLRFMTATEDAQDSARGFEGRLADGPRAVESPDDT